MLHTAPEHVSSMSRRLDAAIQRALDDKRIVGTVVLVARHGELVHHTGAGLVGTARDVLTLLETVRTGGDDLLTPATVHAW